MSAVIMSAVIMSAVIMSAVVLGVFGVFGVFVTPCRRCLESDTDTDIGIYSTNLTSLVVATC